MTPVRAVLFVAIMCQGLALPAAAGPPVTPWTKHDYINFYFSHFNGHLPLPHLREDAPRVLFERMVDRENLQRIAGSAAPIEDKQRHVAMILMTMGEIRAAYNYAVLVGEPLQEELARVQAFTLQVLDTAIRLSPATISDRSRTDAWRTTYFGVIQSLDERGTYSGAQRASLAEALAHHYPVVSGILSTAERGDIESRIARLMAVETDPALRIAYAQLLEAVQAN